MVQVAMIKVSKQNLINGMFSLNLFNGLVPKIQETVDCLVGNKLYLVFTMELLSEDSPFWVFHKKTIHYV